MSNRNYSKSQLEHIKKVNERISSNHKSLFQLKKENFQNDDVTVNEIVDAFNKISIEIEKIKNKKTKTDGK